jgi:hypothetical protein
MSQQWPYNPEYDHVWRLQLPHTPAGGPNPNANGMDSSGVLVNEAWGNDGAPTQHTSQFDGQPVAQFGEISGPYQPRPLTGSPQGAIARQGGAIWPDMGGPSGPPGPSRAVPGKGHTCVDRDADVSASSSQEHLQPLFVLPSRDGPGPAECSDGSSNHQTSGMTDGQGEGEW